MIQLKYILLIPVIALTGIFSSYSQQENDTIKSDREQLENLPAEVDTTAPPHSVEIYAIPASEIKKQGEPFVPFSVVHQVPVHPLCESLTTNDEQKKCLSEKIEKLINENFDKSIAQNSGLTGRQIITVQFKIDSRGKVVDVLIRAPNSALEEESKRVIGLIPQMQPGKQNGKAIAVAYSLPIVLR